MAKEGSVVREKALKLKLELKTKKIKIAFLNNFNKNKRQLKTFIIQYELYIRFNTKYFDNETV